MTSLVVSLLGSGVLVRPREAPRKKENPCAGSGWTDLTGVRFPEAPSYSRAAQVLKRTPRTSDWRAIDT
jgi:hypothetical protein